MNPRRLRAPNRARGFDYLAHAERELYPFVRPGMLCRAQRRVVNALAKQRAQADGLWPESKVGTVPSPSARKMRTYRARLQLRGAA